jgi:hypothetical protein
MLISGKVHCNYFCEFIAIGANVLYLLYVLSMQQKVNAEHICMSFGSLNSMVPLDQPMLLM